MRKLCPVIILPTFILYLYAFAVSVAEGDIGETAPRWCMLEEKSSISFEAIQNGAPVTGVFESFTADITFDPRNLEHSKVVVTVDMASVSTAFAEVAETLKTTGWFDVAKFPQAVFTTRSIHHVIDNKYEADAALTIRNQTVPLTLNFTLDEYEDKGAAISGEAVISRNAYNIGQGEWADTSVIKDEVRVKVKVTADRHMPRSAQ